MKWRSEEAIVVIQERDGNEVETRATTIERDRAYQFKRIKLIGKNQGS